MTTTGSAPKSPWYPYTVTISTKTRRPLGLSVVSRNGRIYVTSVESGGLGAEVGILPKDRISYINGAKVTTKWDCEKTIFDFSKRCDFITLDMRRKVAGRKDATDSTVAPKPGKPCLSPESLAGDKLVPLPSINYTAFCMPQHESGTTGDPFYGLTLSAPPDICDIIRTKVHLVLTDFRRQDLNIANAPAVANPSLVDAVGFSSKGDNVVDQKMDILKNLSLAAMSESEDMMSARELDSESPATDSKKLPITAEQQNRDKAVIIANEVEYYHIGTDSSLSARQMRVP